MSSGSSSQTEADPSPAPDAGAGVRLKSILVVDDEPGIRSFLKRGLEKRFGLVELVDNARAAGELNRRCHFDLIICDIRLPDISGVEWIASLRAQGNSAAVIFITAHADVESAVAALRAGAADFILKPFRMGQMLAAVERCLERQQMEREDYVLRRQVEQLYDANGLVGDCEQFQLISALIHRVATVPTTVLIEGESGTGKELAARAIHDLSGRSGSFVPINCGAMSAELLESELFGHVKGAFTGAHQAREGLFRYADGGTLFLDEIGEMPPGMQAHLLRVLEQRRIRAVGANSETHVDVRIIAATNRDLSASVSQGAFREDLYFRLNVLTIRMPPLREHKEDLPVLVHHFVNTLAPELGVPVPDICDSEIVKLRDYDWPGNVRELKNVIERCLLLDAPPDRCLAASMVSGQQMEAEGGESLLLQTVEKRHILTVLELSGGNKSLAARRLGISRKTLERRVQTWAAG